MAFNDGVNNEYRFIEEINRLKFKDMNFNIQIFIGDLYNNNVLESDLFYCWKNKLNQKSDIFIKKAGDDSVKGISIKMGSRNSVHMERLDSFLHFMSDLGYSNYYLDILRKYQYKDYTTCGNGKIRLRANEYQEIFFENIRNINNKIKNDSFFKSFANRFLLQGVNSNFFVDAIIHGTPFDFLYIKREDVYFLIKSHLKDCSKAIHFSFLTLQTKDANLSFNPKNEKYRGYIQIKWYNIDDIIIENMNNKVMNG